MGNEQLVCTGIPTNSVGQGLGCKLGVSWSEPSEPNVILGLEYPPPLAEKSVITTYSAYVSHHLEVKSHPMSINIAAKTFVGPHHGPKILGQNPSINH